MQPKPILGQHISLFAGVGMTDLAVERAGFVTTHMAEIDPWCQRLLRCRYPGAVVLDDVTELSASDFSLSQIAPWPNKPSVDQPVLLSGGFPCQDVSWTGYGPGLQGTRSGLWFEFERLIEEVRPEFVLIENVAALLRKGLTVIVRSLAAMGYDLRWDCITAQSVGAPHLRDRLFVVATNVKSLTPIGRRLDEGALITRAGSSIDGAWYSDTPRAPRRIKNLIPTPTKSDGTGGPGTSPKRTGGRNLRTWVAEHYPITPSLTPEFCEWLMGVPVGWTNAGLSNHELDRHSWSWGEQPPPGTMNPRCIKDRGRRIQACGNGLVPEAASVLLREVLQEVGV